MIGQVLHLDPNSYRIHPNNRPAVVARRPRDGFVIGSTNHKNSYKNILLVWVLV